MVTNTNDAPIITSSAITSVTENNVYSYTFKASDVDTGDSVTLSAPTKPSWLSFNANTGVLSGTPNNSHVGNHDVVLKAIDGSGAVDTQSFTISVANTNSTPTITSTAVTTVNEDTEYKYTLTATDSDSNDTLTLSAPTKPSWLSFDANTGILSGIPTNSDVGNHNVVLKVTDNNGASVSQSFTISVSNTNDAPIKANEINDQTIAEDSTLNFQFASNTFADVDSGDSLTYEALSNGSKLPTWLHFNAGAHL